MSVTSFLLVGEKKYHGAICVDEEGSGKQNAPASIYRILKLEALTLAHDRSNFFCFWTEGADLRDTDGWVWMGSFKASLRHHRIAPVSFILDLK